MAGKLHFVTVLPAVGVRTPSSVYFVTSATTGFVDVHITNDDASDTLHLNNIADTNSAITAAIGTALSGVNYVQAVANLSGLTTLSTATPDDVMIAYVADPRAGTATLNGVSVTGDNTIVTGFGTYMWLPATTTWTKVGEGESMDLVLAWSSLTGGPTSTPAQIDAAVAASHSHTNAAELAKIGETAGGLPTYNNIEIVTVGTVEW